MQDKKPTTTAQKKQLKIIQKFSKALESLGAQFIVVSNVQGMTTNSIYGDADTIHSLLKLSTYNVCENMGLPGMTKDETKDLVKKVKESILKEHKPEAKA